jgi:hypothetical protein
MVEMIALQEVWEAAGGRPEIVATKEDVITVLKLMDECVDEQDDDIKKLVEENDKLKRDIKDIEREYLNSDTCFNAVISYMLGKGYTEEPLEFLRCWNEGNFDALREEWPDAPKEIYYADPLYKGE